MPFITSTDIYSKNCAILSKSFRAVLLLYSILYTNANILSGFTQLLHEKSKYILWQRYSPIRCHIPIYLTDCPSAVCSPFRRKSNPYKKNKKRSPHKRRPFDSFRSGSDMLCDFNTLNRFFESEFRTGSIQTFSIFSKAFFSSCFCPFGSFQIDVAAFFGASRHR